MGLTVPDFVSSPRAGNLVAHAMGCCRVLAKADWQASEQTMKSQSPFTCKKKSKTWKDKVGLWSFRRAVAVRLLLAVCFAVLWMVRRKSGWGICVLPFCFGSCFVFWLLWFALLHVTTCVHVEVFLIAASSHVRTEPQSVIGHTRGKKKMAVRLLRLSRSTQRGGLFRPFRLGSCLRSVFKFWPQVRLLGVSAKSLQHWVSCFRLSKLLWLVLTLFRLLIWSCVTYLVSFVHSRSRWTFRKNRNWLGWTSGFLVESTNGLNIGRFNESFDLETALAA